MGLGSGDALVRFLLEEAEEVGTAASSAALSPGGADVRLRLLECSCSRPMEADPGRIRWHPEAGLKIAGGSRLRPDTPSQPWIRNVSAEGYRGRTTTRSVVGVRELRSDASGFVCPFPLVPVDAACSDWTGGETWIVGTGDHDEAMTDPERLT